MAIKANEAWTMRRGYSPKAGSKAPHVVTKSGKIATGVKVAVARTAHTSCRTDSTRAKAR
jgi:hypothetical protein